MTKSILSMNHFYQGYGTNKYRVHWVGDYTAEELINKCDGGSYNYGGRIDGKKQLADGSYTGTVCVYYD